jgi:DNA-binding transcriptional ArsR family regulator
MSIEVMTLVGKSTLQSSGRKFVLMALANFADEEGSCFPTVAQLSAWTGQADKTVRDHLDGLERDGIITRERTRREDGTLGRYRFFIHRRNLPLDDHRRISPEADFARGEKGRNPPADFAAQEPSTKPSSTSSLRSDSERKRASRLSEDWRLPDDWRTEAIGLGIEPRSVDLEAEKMRDWSRASKNGAKLDWRATWRNWCREAVSRPKPRGSPLPPKQTMADVAARLAQELNEANDVRSSEGISGIRQALPNLSVVSGR